MKFRDKSISTLYAYALAAVFALTLAGCGGSGGSAMDMDDDDDMPMGASQATCEGAGGRYNADDTCSSAEDLEAERIAAAVQAERERIEAEQAAAAAAASALKAAQDAARIASASAAASVTAAEAHKDLDLVTFIRAQIAAENAAAASAAALLAIDPGAAEAAQADAEAAEENAKKYSGMVLAMAKAITDMMAEDAAAAEVIRLAMVEANALQSAKGDAQAAYDAAVDALAAVDPYKDAELVAHTRATDALKAVSDANDAVKAAGTSAAAEALIAAVEEARDVVTGFTAMVTAAKADADKAKVAADKMAADALAAAEAKEAQNEMVETKVDAISDEAGLMPRPDGAPFDDNEAAEANTNYTLKISHKDGAASVAVTDSAMSGKNDPQFEMMDGKYVRDNGNGVAEIVGVHTDIEPAKDTLFGKVYGLTVGDSDPDQTGDQSTTYEVLGGDNGRIKSAKFPTLASTVTMLPSDNDTTPSINEGEVKGTFDGATGTFECVVANGMCTLNTDADGKLTMLTAGDWQFTPDDGETVSVTDADYLHYGFWLKKTVKDGVTTYNEVQTFAGSSLLATTEANIGMVVVGSAKYEGDAAGVYAYNTVKADSSIDNRSAGTFTADVSLTAHFIDGEDVDAAANIAPNKLGSVEGTVSKFELSGGEANKWEVTLATGAGVLAMPTFIGTAKGTKTDDGAWNGAFHGNGVDLDGEGGESDVAPPPVVVGEFDANFANGSVAGGFGARYKK